MPHRELPKSVQEHAARVGCISRRAAKACGKDEHAAYLAGVFHDDGKVHMPPDLFDGKDITLEQYELIKGHAVKGYLDLKEKMPFTGLCTGLSHEMGQDKGYGISMEEIPKEFSFMQLKKLLDISTIVAIADFIDAFSTRTTSLLCKPLGEEKSLVELLYTKYPYEHLLIDLMLKIAEEMYHETKEATLGEGEI